MISGKMNNVLENSFSQIETHLPKTFRALETAAKGLSNTFPKVLYENLCGYCTFLLGSSLFAKPIAVVTFLEQINFELEKGESLLLKELRTPDDMIARFRNGFLQGGRVIMVSENVLQTVFRLQFERSIKRRYSDFLRCKWNIYNSPIDLPMSDIGLIEIRLDDVRFKMYLLPISPTHVLEGVFHMDHAKIDYELIVKGADLEVHQAEYVLDCICASAVIEVVCSQRNIDVLASRERAKNKKIRFNTIVDPQHVISAGLQNASEAYTLQMVSIDDYAKFIRRFIAPPLLE